MAKLERFRNDEEFKNQRLAKMNEAWSNADANGDGKLDRAEFGAWAEAMRKMKTEEGEWNEPENCDDTDYEIMNGISEGDGFTMPEMMTVFGPWMAKFEALKAADGQ